AEVAGVAERVRADIASVLGEPVLERLLTGSRTHAVRRAEEMYAAAELVRELGIPPRVATAAAAWLEQLRDAWLRKRLRCRRPNLVRFLNQVREFWTSPTRRRCRARSGRAGRPCSRPPRARRRAAGASRAPRASCR